MSEEGDVVMAEETPVVEPEVEETIDLESALAEVLKKALIANGLGRGLRECQKALEQGSVHLCILAADCNEAAYVSLITALCLERGVKLLKVKKAKQLGEWAGLRKLDREGKPRKVVSTSCVVIKNYGEESKYLTFLLNYLESNKDA
jgi:small subunit ribosomal protein S12e